MSRPSSAALLVSQGGVDRRPDPPDELTVDERRIWLEVVKSMPVEWFPIETHGLLIQYCRLRIRARKVAIYLSSMEKRRGKGKTFSMSQYRNLLKDEDRITKQIAALARCMRLSQSATSKIDYVRKRPLALRKPWDRDDPDDQAATTNH